MNDFGLLCDILKLKAPWRVLEVRDDLRTNQLDLWIGVEPPRKSWIFGRAAPEQGGDEYVWRHANLGALRCVIHASLPDGTDTADLHWCGERDGPFTHALSQKVAALISAGVPLHHICSVLDLAVEELWKFRYAIDKGKSRISPEALEAPTAGDAARDEAVPLPDDPVWQALLEGNVRIDIRILGLKLFLAKLREQMPSIKDDEVRTLKCYELQRYFARNVGYLAHELAQLRRH
jgi:hypothetical protein